MDIFSILQIIACFLLVLFILIQQRGTALGSTFGGEGGFYTKKRGPEKFVFIASIVLAILFVALSIVNLIT